MSKYISYNLSSELEYKLSRKLKVDSYNVFNNQFDSLDENLKAVVVRKLNTPLEIQLYQKLFSFTKYEIFYKVRSPR